MHVIWSLETKIKSLALKSSSSKNDSLYVGLIPTWGTKIPHVVGELSLHSTTREACELQGRTHVPKPRPRRAQKIESAKKKPNSISKEENKKPRQLHPVLLAATAPAAFPHKAERCSHRVPQPAFQGEVSLPTRYG